MKRFRFNLERVLTLRKYIEKNREIKLGTIISKCNVIQNRIKLLEQNRISHFRNFKLQNGGIDYLQTLERYFNKLEADRLEFSSELASLNEEKERAQEEYLEASRRRKTIEKVKEKKEQNYYREQLIEESKELDDIGTQFAVRNQLRQT